MPMMQTDRQPRRSALNLRRSRPAFLIATLILMSMTKVAYAARDEPTWEESDELPAVQNRKYRMEHELAAGIGLLPTDPYTKGVAVSGSYTWHLNNLWGVRGDFSWVFNYNSSLRDKLEENFGIQTTRFDKIKLFGQLGGLFKPLYGKLAFLNDAQIYGELYLSLNAVVAQLEGGRKTDTEPQGKGERLAFGTAPGLGIRGFITPHLSARLDLSWMILVAQSGEIHTPLLLNLSFAMTTRSDL